MTAALFFHQQQYTFQAAAFNFQFRLRNDLYCVEWGVKLYSLTSTFNDLPIELPIGSRAESQTKRDLLIFKNRIEDFLSILKFKAISKPVSRNFQAGTGTPTEQ